MAWARGETLGQEPGAHRGEGPPHAAEEGEEAQAGQEWRVGGSSSQPHDNEAMGRVSPRTLTLTLTQTRDRVLLIPDSLLGKAMGRGGGRGGQDQGPSGGIQLDIGHSSV